MVVHDVGRDAATGTVYIALEYLEGHTLAEVTADGTPMDWRQALRITEKLAEALHHAHAKGIVHRDIKPANIMVMASSGQPKVMDFGIAKLPASTLTTAGEFFGTPSFMSPEQAGGEPALDGRSDLFSLGCVLYQLLTGKRAFDGGTLPAILMRVMKDDPPPPSQAVPGPASRPRRPGRQGAGQGQGRIATRPASRWPRTSRTCWPGVPRATPPQGGGVTAVPESTDQGDTAPGLATGRLSEVLSAVAGTSVLRTAPRRGLRRRHILLLAALGAGDAARPGRLGRLPLHPPRRPARAHRLPDRAAPDRSRGRPRARSRSPSSTRLESGSIKVWVDDAVVLEKPIEGRVTKKVLNFRLYRGSFSGTVDVAPGDRTVRVQVIGRRLQRLPAHQGRLRERDDTAAPRRGDGLAQAGAAAVLGLVTRAGGGASRRARSATRRGARRSGGVSFEVASGRVLVLLGTQRLGQDHRAQDDQRPGDARRGVGRRSRPGRLPRGPDRAAPAHRLRDPGGGPAAPPERRRQRRPRPRAAGLAAGATARARPRAAGASCGSTPTASGRFGRRSSPAASASAWGSRARSPPIRRSC